MKRVNAFFGVFFKCISSAYLSKMNSDSHPSVKRLLNVEGYDGRRNDIVYHSPLSVASLDLVFFGGDVQDYPEKMLSHRDNKRHGKWNLENTAALLHSRFPSANIYIIRPSRMHLNTFSCYDNFVKSNDVGVPQHANNADSLKHMKALLDKAKEQISSENSSDQTCSVACRNVIPLIIIGFSKGCVVLNQMLHSFKAYQDEKVIELDSFVKSIEAMYWLEGGHSGGSNTWIGNKTVLKQFADTNINVIIHVTPYQMQCNFRPWIGKEEKLFRETLKRFGVKVERTMHFEDEERSMENHFRVLEVFSEVKNT
ncbi:UPF0565 protein C2orf69 homolog [Centruroides sculpturatus]|uniref:UPF0565 protein C2orf69 homolog n=1 Tax=Centruroides sculpturatus TaxID=218467 RepID=UPI000C6EA0A4|nr:UPF0565 protein C2orf69 homolog [Centruroides sculpturatus]